MLQNCEVKRAWVEIRTAGSTEQVKFIIIPTSKREWARVVSAELDISRQQAAFATIPPALLVQRDPAHYQRIGGSVRQVFGREYRCADMETRH